MRKLIENLPPLMEQAHLRSAPIETIAKTHRDQYGIVFLTLSDDPKLNPGNKFSLADVKAIASDIFLGTVMENTVITGPEGHLPILGGYYIEKKNVGGKKSVVISQVFGIATDASEGFGLKDGEDKMFGDTWKLQNHFTHNERALVDERELADDGWTFIVDYTPDVSIFPASGDPVNFSSNCPEISVFSKTQEPAPGKEGFIQVTIKLDVENGPVGSFSWDWGDGSPAEITSNIELSHDYKQTRGDGPADNYTIKIDSSGPGTCKDSTSTDVGIPPKPHPALVKVVEVARRDSKDKKTIEVDFEASLLDPSNPHTGYEWDFGDKKPKKKSTDLTITHSFERRADVYKPTITIDGNGPDTCHSSVFTKILIPPLAVDCPTIGQVKQIEKTNLNGGKKTQYKLRAEFTGASPRQFVWTWGDNERAITDVPEVDIILDRTDEDARPVIITLDTLGPGNCRGKSDICVHVPGLETTSCPWYMKAFPYGLVLLLTLLICAVITCYVGISMEKVIQGATDHLYTWTIIMAFLTIIAGFVWAAIGKKTSCPPRKCSIMFIAWVSMAAVAVFVAMIQACFDNFLLLFAVFLILAVVFRYLYYKSCKDKMSLNQEVLFLLVGAAAFLIAYFVHATPCLDCI